MAYNCYHFGYYEKVVQLMKASITVSAFNQNLDIQRYNTLALAYKKLNKLDRAAFISDVQGESPVLILIPSGYDFRPEISVGFMRSRGDTRKHCLC